MLRSKGIDSDKKIADYRRVGIKASIKERFHSHDLLFFWTFIIFLDGFPFIFAQFSDRYWHVSEVAFILKEFLVDLVCKISDCPREDVVLWEIVEAPSWNIINLHQILVVADRSFFPKLAYFFNLLLDILSMNNFNRILE